MCTEPLQSLGPDHDVALQHVVRHAPQLPAAAGLRLPAVSEPCPGAGTSPRGTATGGASSELVEGGGCACAGGAAAAGPASAVAASAAATAIVMRISGASFRCTSPHNGNPRVALSVLTTQDVRAGQV